MLAGLRIVFSVCLKVFRKDDQRGGEKPNPQDKYSSLRTGNKINVNEVKVRPGEPTDNYDPSIRRQVSQ